MKTDKQFSFFDFVNSINYSKEDLFRSNEENQKEYNPFMINRSLSYFYDTVLYANEMNFHRNIDKKMQHDFYLYSIPKKKRFTKWHKKDKIEERVNLLIMEYGFSQRKAISILDLIPKEEFERLEEKYSQGGKKYK